MLKISVRTMENTNCLSSKPIEGETIKWGKNSIISKEGKKGGKDKVRHKRKYDGITGQKSTAATD